MSHILQGAISGLVVSTVVIFWIVIGAYVYQAPLPVLPFDTSGCGDNIVESILGSYKVNEVDILNPVLVEQEETDAMFLDESW